jgi:hypothetical protein
MGNQRSPIHLPLDSAQLHSDIYHVKRELNGVANNCAHQALQTTVCLFLSLFLGSIVQLTAVSHVFYIALHSLNIPSYVLHSVYCA